MRPATLIISAVSSSRVSYARMAPAGCATNVARVRAFERERERERETSRNAVILFHLHAYIHAS